MALTEYQKRQAEKNRRYWADREAEQLKHNITEEKEYDKEIKRIHQNMLDACQKEIESFYAKYAKAEGITMAEAKKRVSKLDIAAYERKAAKYVKEKDFSQKANEEMRLYNATMKINRLEMLKANIGLELIAGHDELEKFMGGILKGRTMDELKRQAGILGKSVKNNAAKADAIVNGSFHSGTFSDRIWQYQDLMRQDLGKLLQQGLIQGKGARAITKDLRKYLVGDKQGKGATYNVERLMRTELARVQTEAQKQSFIRNGFEYYEFICNFHASKNGTCDICQGLNGKHFKVKDMMPGENAPPVHPHCRCSVAAWEDDAEYEAWLDYLERGGTTKSWIDFKNSKITVANSVKDGTIGLERAMADGFRNSRYYVLDDEEIEFIASEAEAIGIPRSMLKFNFGSRTGYVEYSDSIHIKGDILPDATSARARDMMSVRAVLAHEYYGHRANRPSEYENGDWRDEFRASYDAAVNAPNLTDKDRADLMVDAYDRARENNDNRDYDDVARRIIYGY